jgi:hypothetical protein
MGILIGGPDTSLFGGVSTWGRLRRAVGQYVEVIPSTIDYRQPTVQEYHNLGWDAVYYFTSAASGGFVKGGYVMLAPPNQQFSFQPTFPYIQVNPSGPAPIDSVVTSANTFDTNTLVAQLVGEAVTGNGGTFNYTALMNTSAVQVAAGGYAATPITAIGKLAQTV